MSIRQRHVGRNRLVGAAAVGFSVFLAAGCVEEKEVYIEVPRWEEPPAAAAGFVGYAKQEQKLTVCGNCHVGMQAEWRQTAHANAWESLQKSGRAQKFCEACHAVSSLGNPRTDENVGWVATGDKRYYDVQCESCHGPGLEHVTTPDRTQPLAGIAVGKDMKSGCGECHTGAHYPFVEEWAQSRHGQLNAFPAGRADCAYCHEAKAILTAWNVKADYTEKTDGKLYPIVCAVCHDPHDAVHEGQLRFSISEPHEETNLCMRCHHKRGMPDPTTWRGPHSPEGPMLLGQAGWRPPNFEYAEQTIIGTHGTERNPKLCAGCHVNAFTVTDPAGNFLMNATGHLFEPIPCLDVQGKPVAGGECALEQRSFKACTASGCHGSATAVRSAFLVARKRLDDLVAVIGSMIARIPKTEFNERDNRYTTGEGAKFNMELAQRTGSAVHNPFLAEALLTASIKQIEKDYGIKPAPGVPLENVLQAPAGVVATR